MAGDRELLNNNQKYQVVIVTIVVVIPAESIGSRDNIDKQN
jgi:hypothetical protein